MTPHPLTTPTPRVLILPLFLYPQIPEAAAAAHEAADRANGADDQDPHAATTTGDLAADVYEGTKWFSLHHTSVGISFGAVAAFLIALFVVWSCYKSNMCGVFNCCLLCKPSAHTTAVPSPPAWPGGTPAGGWNAAPPPPYAAVVAPDHPYSFIGSASTAYGLTIPALPAHRAPRRPSRSQRTPTRDDSPSAVSRIFLDARRNAASYSSRFTDVTDSA